MRFLNFIAEDLNGFIWGWFGIVLLLGTGIIMTSCVRRWLQRWVPATSRVWQAPLPSAVQARSSGCGFPHFSV